MNTIQNKLAGLKIAGLKAVSGLTVSARCKRTLLALTLMVGTIGASAQALLPSGTFQFTTANYAVSSNEGFPAADPGQTLRHSLLGARITVTRSGGANGRVQVPILTVPTTNMYRTSYTLSTNGFSNPVTVPIGTTNSGPSAPTQTNILVFDDYQMSASLLLSPAQYAPNSTSSPIAITAVDDVTTNFVYTNTIISLDHSLDVPILDPLESSDLQPPTLGAITTEKITVEQASGVSVNSVLNLERATFRVDKDETGTAVIHVTRSGGSFDQGVHVNYGINLVSRGGIRSGFAGNPNPGNTFALEAGSDYAVDGVDFTSVTGQLTWGANDGNDKTITIPITNSGLVEFNLDLQVQLWIDAGDTEPADVGAVNKATLTILSDSLVDGVQSAGSVDRSWNKDNSDGFDSTPPYLQFPGTKGGVSDTANGNGGTVYASVEQPDGKAIIAGSFNSFDSNPYNRIVRLLRNGYQDPTFLAPPNSGANDVINALALQPDGKIIIGGNFTAFNGVNRYHIARLNTDGSVDTSFNPGLGADGTVLAVSLRSDGKIVIGGDFTHYNGTASSYLARLNTDGSYDTSFAPGDTINGPVYALAQTGAATVNVASAGTGGTEEDDNYISLGGGNSGAITVNYDMLSVPDDMRIYYGSTNGILIYDTGSVSGTNSITVQFGPTNGFSTNLVTIVMNQGGGETGTFWSYDASLSTFGDSKLNIGGVFDKIGGVESGGVARLNDDGTLDTTFAPGLGTYNPDFGYVEPVYALALQNGKLLVGGSFSYMEFTPYSGLVRLNLDGTVDSTFNPGTGTYNPNTGIVDSIYAITLQPDGKILIGGDFVGYNQTRRVGIARLFDYGSVDTSFMDTAYNQFAGLINHYHNPDAINPDDYPQGNHRNFVSTIAVEPDAPNNVIIGGNFLRVGGGSVYHSGTDMPTNSGIFVDGRNDSHPRSNVARLIGGATEGPGNISLMYGSYSADKSAGTLYVSIVRTNGTLGQVSADCEPEYLTPGPGIATTNDFTGGALPTWPTLYDVSPTRSWPSAPATFGPNYIFDSTYGSATPNPDVVFTIINNTNITGNRNAKVDLSTPAGSLFTLGGEYIPLGTALGFQDLSPLTIIDTNIKPGVFGFNSPTYTVNQGSSAVITVVRTGGTDGTIQINYATTNGTAVSPTNYTATSGTLTFGPGVSSKTFTVPTATGTSADIDRTVNLQLSSVTGGATINLTNAVLTIVNNKLSYGHLGFTSPTFATNETAGIALITVNRLGGSAGTLDATAIVAGGTAVNGVNYAGSTNVLHWNNNDVGIRTIPVPVMHDGIYTPDLTVNLRLTNGLYNNAANVNVLGLSSATNATLTIGNVDFPGTVQFSTASYAVKKSAGVALIPVTRTGGSAQNVSVDFSTFDGSAIHGLNYSNTTGTLTFTNGQFVQYLTVPIIDDGQADGLLSLNVVLRNASPGIAQGSVSNAVLNLIDTTTLDEPPGSPDDTYSQFAGFNGNVYSLAQQPNNQLVVGGDFTQAGGVPRQRLARLNADGSLDAGFLLPSSAMGADDQIRALAVQPDGRIVVGGFFSNFNSVAESRITRLNYDGTLDSTFNPGSGADNSVFALGLAPADGKIYVGGSFARLNGVTFNGIGRLNPDGTADATFNPGGLGAGSVGGSLTVYALAVQADGKILIGGDFVTYNGVTVNHLARLNPDGSLDMAFSAGMGANDSVRAIALQLDGKIVIGGLFTNYNGVVLNRVARLNTDGSVDTSFTPGAGADDMVSVITIQTDGRILLGGQFTHCSGVTRNRITRLNANGTVDPTINFGSGASDFVSALVIQEDTIQGYPTNVPDEKIILGGAFEEYAGEPHAHLARIFGGAVTGSGAFEFSAADYQIDETGLKAVIKVIRTGGTSGANASGSGDIYVPFATSDGTATAGANYLGVATNLDFPAGEIQQTVTIPVMDDGVITPDLTVNLAVNPVAPALYGNQPTAVLTIINNDSAISFATETYQVPKNVVTGVAPISISRLGSATGTASILFSTTTNGTAVIGTDYNPVTNQLVTFNPGVTNVTVSIPVINNPLPTGARTVTMRLTNVVNSLIYAPSNATLTIIDTVHAPGTLSFSSTNLVVGEGDGNAYISVIRTNGVTGVISVNYTTIAGTAVPGINYATTAGTLTFGDANTNQTIIVPLVDNSIVQGPVKFTVRLSNPTGGASLNPATNATVTVLDNDAGIAFSTGTNTVPENNGFAVVNVQRLYNTNAPASAHFATVDGTAVAGINYSNLSGTLNFASGETLKSLSIPLIANTNATGDLMFGVTLSAVTGAQLTAPSNTVVVMQDAQAGVSFTNDTLTVLKSAGQAVITVVCSNPRVEPVLLTTNDIPLQVNYTTVDGTALGGTDYQPVSGTLLFTNGLGTNTFVVPIYNSGLVTGDRVFSVILTNVTAPGQITPFGTQSVVIAESNAGLKFSQSDYRVSKNGITATISVNRTGYTNSVVSVDFLATNGTAISGVNFVSTNGTLLFTNGVTSQSFNVSLIANSLVQPNLVALLQLSNPTNGVLVTPSVATLTLLETGGSFVVPAGAQVVTNYISHKSDGIIGSNDTVQVLFALRDSAGLDVTNLVAYLLATNGVLSPSPASQTYGPLRVYGHSVSRAFTFTAHGTNAFPIAPTFALYDNARPIGTAMFNFSIGTWTNVFFSTNAIVINDNTNASPYPSVINITNVGSTLVKATITLTNLSHTSPADIDALVVSPAQKNTLIMAHAGAQFAVKNITVTLDDAATNSLPFSSVITNGVYKPTGYLPVKNFP